MKPDTITRLKAGIQAGVAASVILGFVIWLFGYVTGDRLALSLLGLVAVCVGLICGAQVYSSNSGTNEQRDEVLAELEELSQDKALGKKQTVAGNKRHGTGKTV